MLGKIFPIRTFLYVYDLIDVDECKGNYPCHKNASCTNTIGSHVCKCDSGFTGNGRDCAGESGSFPFNIKKSPLGSILVNML